MNRKLLLPLAAGITILSTSSFGLANSTLMDSTNFALGPYLGFQAGIGGMDTKKLSKETKTAFPDEHKQAIDNRAIGRISGGYSWVQDFFQYGLEIGFMAYEDNTYRLNNEGCAQHKYKYEGHTVDLLAVIQYYLANNFSAIGKVGPAYVTQKFEQEIAPKTSQSKHKLLPEVSIGISYGFNQNWSVDLTYSHIFGKSPKEFADVSYDIDSKDLYKNVASVNALMIGVQYKAIA